MPITIRPARPAEQQLIRQIVREAQISPFQLDWRRFVVAEADGRVVGTGQVKPHRDGSRELASIAVVPELRHHGIASAIIRQLIAREDGQLVLTCAATLEGFYGRFGFQRVEKDEMPLYFRRFYRFMRMWNGIVMIREAAH